MFIQTNSPERVIFLFPIDNLEEYRPDFYVPSLLSGKWWEMLEGIEGIFTDNDCVIVDPKTGRYNEDAIYFLRGAVERDILKFVIITNTLGRERKKRKAQEIQSYIGFKTTGLVRLEALGMDEKTNPIGFQRGMKGMLLEDPAKILMIGDQLSTDIYGGNRVGMKTCLVDPFGKQEWITRIFNGRKNREIHRQLQLQYSW